MMKLRITLTFLIIISTFLFLAKNARAQDASDQWGPSTPMGAEYQMSAKIDEEVLSGVQTEVWAKAYWPLDIGNKTHPLIILLHGNHETCGDLQNPNGILSCEYT